MLGELWAYRYWYSVYASSIVLFIYQSRTESVSPEHYAVSVRDYFTFCDLPVLPSFCMVREFSLTELCIHIAIIMSQ